MVGQANSKSLQHFIAGEWTSGVGGEFQVLNPLDDSLYAYVAKGTSEDICAAVAAAKG